MKRIMQLELLLTRMGKMLRAGVIILLTHLSRSLSPNKQIILPPLERLRMGVVESCCTTRTNDPYKSLYDARIPYINVHSSKYQLSPLYNFPDRMEEEPAIEQPTETFATRIPLPIQQMKPKIVVLGATGRIGRRIVKRLMASGIDMTVVAFVRNHDKACDTLYDDGMLLEREMYIKHKKSGPKLQMVVGNLVPPQEVFGYIPQSNGNENAEKAAYSAAQFYGESTANYLKQDSEDAELAPNPNQALMDAIEDATAVISSVGTVRVTWPFADYFWFPWRIFRSPKDWCKDPRHPYYVNYHVMKKVLSLAEAEQLRRDSMHNKLLKEQEEIKKEALKRGLLYDQTRSAGNLSNEYTVRDRIKIIRISDLCVAHPAWSFVSVLTNIVRSVVFQSQDMAEILLEQSELVDTVTLRPGDLCDENRNATAVSLQIDTTGKSQCEWSPSYVGRDDVAALAVELALTDISSSATDKNRLTKNRSNNKVARSKGSPFRTRGTRTINRVRHITLAVRWTGEHISQGRKREGLPNAQACVESVLKQEARVDEKIKRLEEMSTSAWTRFRMNAIATWNKRRVKPYGLFVLIPLMMLYPTLFSMILSVISMTPLKASLTSLISFSERKFLPLIS